MSRKKAKNSSPEKQRVYTSLLLVLLALVSVVAATVAWFTIADSTKLKSMDLEITTGANLRFDLDPHSTFDQYVKTLNFKQIAERIQKEKGFDLSVVPLDPVTTSDYQTFTLEDGTVVQDDSGSYLEFTLHFMASADMWVHLTSASSQGKSDGTLVSSENANLPPSMRISFTVGNKVNIYNPGMGASSVSGKNQKTFGLASGSNMVLSQDNALFYLKKEIDQPVVVHIWLEGTDENCTDKLRGAQYSIALRFIGTDGDNNALE